jgi:cold shock CspA family protein
MSWTDADPTRPILSKQAGVNADRARQILQHTTRMASSRCGVFVHIHEVEAAGMKMLVAGQLVAYEVGPARDGRSKAVNLRLVQPGARTARCGEKKKPSAEEKPRPGTF